METKTLIVEDKHYDAAKTFFGSIGVEVDIAKDYAEAMKLGLQNYAGILTDCFFPEETGTGKREKGEQILEEIVQEFESIRNPHLRSLALRINQEEQFEGKSYEDTCVSHEDALVAAERWLGFAREILPEEARKTYSEIELVEYLKSNMRLANSNLPQTANEFMRYLTHTIYGEGTKIYEASAVTEVVVHDKLVQNLRKSEENQPLGLLVCEQARKLGIPALIVTDTHHHDNVFYLITKYMDICPKKELHGVYMFDAAGKITGYKNEAEGWKNAYELFQRIKNK